MDLRRAGIAVLMAAGVAATATAQGRVPSPQPPSAETRLDVSRLPVNLQRIQRELRQSTSTEERDGLNLRYQIEVYGRAPEIRLFTPEDNLTTGPVPYGAPTHREVIEHITPQEYRSPVMDFNSLFRWLAEKSKK
jgi:hypothetical protein